MVSSCPTLGHSWIPVRVLHLSPMRLWFSPRPHDANANFQHRESKTERAALAHMSTMRADEMGPTGCFMYSSSNPYRAACFTWWNTCTSSGWRKCVACPGTKTIARSLSAAARATHSVQCVGHASSARMNACVFRQGCSARPTSRRMLASSWLFNHALFRRCTMTLEFLSLVVSHLVSAAVRVREFSTRNCGNAFCTSVLSAGKARREKAVRRVPSPAA